MVVRPACADATSKAAFDGQFSELRIARDAHDSPHVPPREARPKPAIDDLAAMPADERSLAALVLLPSLQKAEPAHPLAAASRYTAPYRVLRAAV